MKEDKLYRSLEYVRDEYLDSAADAMQQGRATKRIRKTRVWLIAACMVLVVSLLILPIYNILKQPTLPSNDISSNNEEIQLTASEIAEIFKGAKIESGGTNQYKKTVVSDPNELKIKQIIEEEYVTVYEYCQAEKELSEEDFAKLVDRIIPRLSAYLEVSVPDYEITFEKDSYSEGRYDKYTSIIDLGENYQFNASQLKRYDYISFSPKFDSSGKIFLDGEQITAHLTQSDEEIIASLESIKEKLFDLFGVRYNDVKVRRRYDSGSQNKVEYLSVFYYNQSEHPVSPFLGNYDSNFIEIEFDNSGRYSNNIVSEDLLELADIIYVRQRADTKTYTVAGKTKTISLERAEELLAAGYVFGGHACPLCMKEQEKVDFTDYDYVSMSYVSPMLFSTTPVPVVPFYVFYKYLGETENGKLTYGYTYVPAVEVSGLDEYFENQKTEHK